MRNIYLLFRNILFIFVKYRIHLSIIYFYLLLNNNKIVNGLHIDYYLILSLSFWHFSLFLFDRVYDRSIDKLSQPNEYVKDKYAVKLYLIVAFSLIVSLILFILSQNNVLFWLALLPFTFLYTLKIYKNYRFKSFLLIKNLYSALLIYSLPLLLQAYLLNNNEFAHVSLVSLFIYVLVGEIFWDIRDISADKMNNTNTIPNTFGINLTKILLILLIVLEAIISGNYISMVALVYILLVIFVKEHSDRLIFHIPPLMALINFIL